jgi:hypothetical protein
MPHLIIERLQKFPELLVLPLHTHVDRIANVQFGAYALEVLAVSASCIFLAGSICFLPKYAEDTVVLYAGCWLFIIGSALYCIICAATLTEAILHKRDKETNGYEIAESILFLTGSILYLIGSILYIPAKIEIVEMSLVGLSLGQSCAVAHFSDREFLATVLFIVGSCLFVLGAFFNALNPRRFDETSSRLLTASSSIYMIGSVLFATGSIALLPHLGCGEDLMGIAAWSFIVGSVFFLVGDALSFYRTVHVFRGHTDKNGDQCGLLSQ